MKVKEFLFGNYENEDDYIPNFIRRFINKFSSYKKSGKFCSCGFRSYCFFHYIFPIESEKIKFNNQQIKPISEPFE